MKFIVTALVVAFPFVASSASLMQPLAEPTICTEETNEWGNAALCNCEKNYRYGPRIGLCYFAPRLFNTSNPTICTRDINAWGHPSVCRCSAEDSYNAKTGNCHHLSSIPGTKAPSGICTMDMNPWGNASVCHCTNASIYNQQIGYCHASLLQGVLVNIYAVADDSTGFALMGYEREFLLEISIPETLSAMADRLVGLSVELELASYKLFETSGRGSWVAPVVETMTWLE